MSNWCKNRLVVTGQSVFVDELQQWVNGHVVPDYRHAIQQSCRMFLAGCAGILKQATVKPGVYVPYPSLLAHPGVSSAQNLAFEQWFWLLKADAPLTAENPRDTAGKALVESGITRFFKLHVVIGGDAAVPGAGIFQVKGLAVENVGFFAVIFFHQRIAVGVLRVTGVEVALATVTRPQLQRLHWHKFPAQNRIDVLIDKAFTAGGIGTGVSPGTRSRMAFVDILGIGLCFIPVTVEAQGQVIGQRAA